MSATGAAAPPPASGHAPWRAGHQLGNLGHQQRIVAVFGGGFLVLMAIGLLIAALSKPPAPKPNCPGKGICVNPRPAPPPPGAAKLLFAKLFTSSGLGYQVEYPAGFILSGTSPDGVTMFSSASDSGVTMVFDGAPAAQTTPQQMLDRTLSKLHAYIPDISADTDPAVQILAPELGGHAGVGGFYQGNFASPQGFQAPADIAVLASTDGHQSVSVAVISANRGHTDDFFRFVDEGILETLRYHGDLPQ